MNVDKCGWMTSIHDCQTSFICLFSNGVHPCWIHVIHVRIFMIMLFIPFSNNIHPISIFHYTYDKTISRYM